MTLFEAAFSSVLARTFSALALSLQPCVSRRIGITYGDENIAQAAKRVRWCTKRTPKN